MKKTLTHTILLSILILLMSITATAFAATPNYLHLFSSANAKIFIDMANTHIDPNNPDIAYVYAMGTKEGTAFYATYTYNYQNRTKCLNSAVLVHQGKSRILLQNNTKASSFEESGEKDFDEMVARLFGKTTLATSNNNNSNNIDQPTNSQVNTTPPNNTGKKRVVIWNDFNETTWKESQIVYSNERLLPIEEAKRANAELTQELAKRVSQKAEVISGANVADVFNNTIRKYENIYGKKYRDWYVPEATTAYMEIVNTLNVDFMFMVRVDNTCIANNDEGIPVYIMDLDFDAYGKSGSKGGMAETGGLRDEEPGFRGAISHAAKSIMKLATENNFW